MDCEIKALKKDLKSANKELRGLNKLLEQLHKIAVAEEGGKLSISSKKGGELSVII